MTAAFQRPEDGAWDPNHPNDFYFVTTASFNNRSRLWRLRFDDIRRPELGGTVEMLLTGDEGPKTMDNLTVTAGGQLLIQEDPGENPHLATIWSYDIATGALTPVAQLEGRAIRPAPRWPKRWSTSGGANDGKPGLPEPRAASRRRLKATEVYWAPRSEGWTSSPRGRRFQTAWCR